MIPIQALSDAARAQNVNHSPIRRKSALRRRVKNCSRWRVAILNKTVSLGDNS